MASREADRIISLYERHARDYNADRAGTTPGLEKSWLDRFLALIQPGGTVLDIGCGVGKPMAQYMIERGFRVTGLDSSPAMIGFCKPAFPDMEWRVGDMRTLSLDQTFDGILTWDSFFHLAPEDQRNMFAVFAKHAGRSAALMFTSGPAFGEAIGEYRGEPLYHASLAPDEYRSLLRSAGFEVMNHIAEDPDCGGHTAWLAAAI
jgi:SAM-dependent methyltransferase